MMRRLIALGFLLALLANLPLAAQQKKVERPKVERPKIRGVAHVAFYVSDLGKARAFYEGLLGFAEPYSLKRDDGADRIAFVKINDNQYVELFADPPSGDGQLNHVAFYVDDAERMRAYLASRGVAVPAAVAKGKIGNLNFTVRDPDGHGVEFVQYTPDGWTAKHRGKDMPAQRVSKRLMHAGFTVASAAASMRFYEDILGFTEFWRGSSNDTELSWINLRVPDGEDYVELMLYRDPPSPERRGTQNHICLEVPEIEKAAADLRGRAPANGYARAIEVRVGRTASGRRICMTPTGHARN